MMRRPKIILLSIFYAFIYLKVLGLQTIFFKLFTNPLRTVAFAALHRFDFRTAREKVCSLKYGQHYFNDENDNQPKENHPIVYTPFFIRIHFNQLQQKQESISASGGHVNFRVRWLFNL